jgi:hypothetical protein
MGVPRCRLRAWPYRPLWNIGRRTVPCAGFAAAAQDDIVQENEFLLAGFDDVGEDEDNSHAFAGILLR